MIRFCDKEVYVIREGEMSRGQMLSFLLKNINTVFVILDQYDNYYGITYYKKIISNETDYVVRKVFIANDEFWQSAREHFSSFEDDMIMVINEDGDMLGFAYNDLEFDKTSESQLISTYENALEISVSFKEVFSKTKHVHITDFNEAAYRIYHILEREGVSLSVFGEGWEWFGIMNQKPIYPQHEVLYLYAEGAGLLREMQPYKNGYSHKLEGVFGFLDIWTNANIDKDLKLGIQYLERKGISVLECKLPEFWELKNLTDIEKMGVAMNCDPALFGVMDEKSMYGEFQKKVLFETIGEASYEMCKNGSVIDTNGMKRITYTKYPLEVIDDNIGDDRKRIYLIGPCIVGGCRKYI